MMTNWPAESAVASATVLPASRSSTFAFGAARPAMTASPEGSTFTTSNDGLSGAGAAAAWAGALSAGAGAPGAGEAAAWTAGAGALGAGGAEVFSAGDAEDAAGGFGSAGVF